MFSKAIQSIIASLTLFVPLNSFSSDITCKDEKGKLIFTFNFEKPISSQISNKLGMKTAVFKGFNDANDRYSFIANSVIEDNIEENHNLTLIGFGQITKKSTPGKRSISSIKSIKLRIPNQKSTKNLGTVEFISTTFLQTEEQKFEYSGCHFEVINTKEIKIYLKTFEALNVKK